jgi:hypothetical protein
LDVVGVAKGQRDAASVCIVFGLSDLGAKLGPLGEAVKLRRRLDPEGGG